MNNFDAILNYKTSISIFNNWAVNDLISSEELLALDAMLVQKYGLSPRSIYRELDLLCVANRVIYSGTEGEAYEENCK